MAADDQGATTTSSEVPIVVYDAAGTPVTHITAPADGDVMEGPTNLLVTATANAIAGVTNVQFLANGVAFADSTTAPYSALWNAPFGTSFLTTVVSDAAGVTGTSAAVRVVITIPPTNFVGPTIARQVPAAFATVTNLTNIVITFSERVHGVDAGDLLINGIPATRVTGSGSNYTFSFTQPAYGEVEIAWAADHGILDFGYPADLPFSELDPASQWEYELVDKTPPTISAHTPGTGVTVTNLGQVSVTFSEPVNGVDAGDLLVNGVASAFSVSGSDQTFTFVISQPNSGTVSISWATNHGITDRAEQPNAFLATGPGATWNFTLDARTSLVESNSTWKFIKGFSEASVPADAWRQPGFNDSGWSNAPAPFFFGDPYTNATITGTLLSDMLSNYTCIFLRREFTVRNRGIITDLFLNSQSDDGYIAWLNGVEVFRYNMPAGEIPFDGTASSAAPEAFSGGANYINNRLTNALSYLVNGTNVLAVQAFNQSLSASTDFGFNAQLFAFITDVSTVAPRVAQASPPPGDLLAFTNVTITFSESVSGVDASDLLVNGVPATGLTNESDSVYTFSFTQPAFGPVQITWAADDGIVDLDEPPKPFDGTAASAILNYTLVDPAKPRVVSQVPAAGSTLTNLTLITVNFTKPVTGVNASDLLINGVATATRVTGGGAAWRFSIPSPPFGNVAVTWATNHGIHDTNVPANDFDPSKFGGTWTYRLVDPAPSVALTSPTNGTYVVGPANVTLRATASDNDGTVSRVEFYVDANKLGEGTNAPYTFSWTNVDLGTYLLRAIATDNLGYRGTSAPVVLNVVTSLPAALVRGPYLQVGSPTGGVVRWRTDLPSDSIVSYGTDAAALAQVIAIPGQTNEHIVALNGLLPDTKYYYSIGSSARTLASGADYWFKTSPPVGTNRPTRLWVLGDSGTANDNARNVRNAFYNYSATNKPADLWLMLGDNAYNSGLDTEYQTAVFDMYPATLRNLF
ncbi:MAG TPA: Ig-like domain-containing protein, partial [Candidatus Saccharimonadales bacterium]|nr:Ig-like domain-containing protein [Candidatus Saccharimonadales bacterium]